MIKIERPIIPLQSFRIKQGQLRGKTHQKRHAWDLTGGGANGYEILAPTTCKIISMPSTSADIASNTVYFGSCDYEGNSACVLCGDGEVRVLTYAMTHCDNAAMMAELEEKFNNGYVFSPGEKCYLEGDKGVSYGIHLHLEVAEGWIFPKGNNTVDFDGVEYTDWQMPYTLDLNKIFYILPDQEDLTNIGSDDTTENYVIRPVTNRFVEANEVTELKINRTQLNGKKVVYSEIDKKIYDLYLEHGDGYTNTMPNISHYNDQTLLAINGGPFTANSETSSRYTIIGILKNYSSGIIGQENNLPKMGFNGNLDLVTSSIENIDISKYEWLRSFEGFSLPQSGETQIDPDFITKNHAVIGQLNNGNYLFAYFESGIDFNSLKTYLLNKGCVKAFNVERGSKADLCAKGASQVNEIPKQVSDTIFVTKKTYEFDRYFSKLKMKVKNVPLEIQSYSGETLTVPVGETISVDRLYRPINNMQV